MSICISRTLSFVYYYFIKHFTDRNKKIFARWSVISLTNLRPRRRVMPWRSHLKIKGFADVLSPGRSTNIGVQIGLKLKKLDRFSRKRGMTTKTIEKLAKPEKI